MEIRLARLDGYNGGNVYRENIRTCGGLPAAFAAPGTVCPATIVGEAEAAYWQERGCYRVLTGNRVGPTGAGVDYLLSLDAGARWVNGTGIVGSTFDPPSSSPRVVPIGVIDIDDYLSRYPNGSGGIARMANIYGFFIEGMGDVLPQWLVSTPRERPRRYRPHPDAAVDAARGNQRSPTTLRSSGRSSSFGSCSNRGNRACFRRHHRLTRPAVGGHPPILRAHRVRHLERRPEWTSRSASDAAGCRARRCTARATSAARRHQPEAPAPEHERHAPGLGARSRADAAGDARGRQRNRRRSAHPGRGRRGHHAPARQADPRAGRAGLRVRRSQGRCRDDDDGGQRGDVAGEDVAIAARC